jgi:GMP synthase (glutamine-hydrolysing)
MRPVLIITHLEDRHSGLVADTLERVGCAVLESNALDNAALPSPGEVSGIVSLGGLMSATQADSDPFLAAEVNLIRGALSAQVPILGMCLGAQLLALASGGHVSTMDRLYVGWPELTLLPPAQDDALFAEFEARLPVLKWHEDMIRVPSDAILLGTTPSPGAALFRIGPTAWGSQMHLEVTPPMLLDGWLAEPRGIMDIESAGYELSAFRAESARQVDVQMAAADSVLTRFAQLTLSR